MAKGNKGGRPKWAPRNPDHARRLVEVLASCGHTHETIASLMDPPCARSTLQDHYRDVLENAVATFKARLESSAAFMALGLPEVKTGNRVVQKAVPPDKTMMIFLLKARFGYRDSQRHEISGLESINISDLSDAQLAQLIDRLEGKLSAAQSGDGTQQPPQSEVGKVH
jgi:hypothetical protein